MSKNSQLYGRRFRYSDFVIPSDFVIRHSDLRIAVCSIKRPVSGLVRAAVGGSVHGKDETTSDGSAVMHDRDLHECWPPLDTGCAFPFVANFCTLNAFTIM